MAKRIILENYTFNPVNRTITILNRAIRFEQLQLITNVTTNKVLYQNSDILTSASSYTVTLTGPSASDHAPHSSNTTATTEFLSGNVLSVAGWRSPGYSTSGTFNISNIASTVTETTVIVLNTGSYLTTQLVGSTSTDRIAILVDDLTKTFWPSEVYTDPVGKMRFGMPQSLIDTDFEYGSQATKWETMALMNNRPGSFFDPTQGMSGISNTLTLPNQSPGTYQITNIVGGGASARLVTVSLNNTTGITTTTPIWVQDATDQNANGWYLPYTVTANTSFTYYARNTVTAGSIFDNTKTYIFVGIFYTQAAIPAGTSAITYSGTTVTVTTTNHHGLTAGQAIFVVGSTTSGSNPPNGAWYVQTVPTSNTFTYTVGTGSNGLPGAISGTVSTVNNASIYVRTWGASIHRAFDGGITFTAGYPYHGNQLIRQTRRYFRYQSGKGIQFSTGSNLCSPFQVDSMTASGTTVTVTTKFVHNINVGARIQVAGADQSAYNGQFIVTSIPTDLTFTYTALSAPSPTTATCISSGSFSVQPFQWYGASIRIGLFDNQNGMYFEYDGITLYAVRRNSTTQLQGYVSAVANGGQVVTGVGTRWGEALIPGDYVVIRGMSYTVVNVDSNTQMTIYPDYRGTTITSPMQVIVSKTIELRTPQNQWNIDRLDGTGESQFTLDLTKMQMWFIDFAWYGAGTVRWGIRSSRGTVFYCHRLTNSNVNTEAFMRSGNLPARYEVNTFYPKTIITNTINPADTTIFVRTTAGFPNTGTVILSQVGNTGAAQEYCTYTGTTAISLLGLSRGVTSLNGPGGQTGMGGAATGQTFTYSATAPCGVAYWGPQSAVTISHWGSAVIMDGRYDDDKSIQFNFGLNTPVTLATANQRYPIFSVRLGPTVDAGFTGLLGQREIINRMQLQPVGLGCFVISAAGCKVELVLNGRVTGSSGNFIPVGGSSLAQYASHGATAAISGGEIMFTYMAPGGGVNTQDLTKIRDIGNSILGGCNTNTPPGTDANKYPDGPDILTVVVTPLAATQSLVCRLSWSEAQA